MSLHVFCKDTVQTCVTQAEHAWIITTIPSNVLCLVTLYCTSYQCMYAVAKETLYVILQHSIVNINKPKQWINVSDNTFTSKKKRERKD